MKATTALYTFANMVVVPQVSGSSIEFNLVSTSKGRRGLSKGRASTQIKASQFEVYGK